MIPETYFTVSEELRLFGISCIWGGFLGAVFDVFRLWRIIFPHNAFLTAAEDVVFMEIFGIFIVCFSTSEARGIFRFYFVFGMILGFSVYLLTIGRITAGTVRKLFRLTEKFLKTAFAPFMRICVLICKKVKLKFVGSSQTFVKSVKNIKKPLQKYRFIVYNKRESKKERT